MSLKPTGKAVDAINVGFWKGRRVFITGHMGFKGAWLCALLSYIGAETYGFGRDQRAKLLYRELNIPRHHHHEGDINDSEAMLVALEASQAEILLHLAAQPLVLTSYADPVGTFEANLMGTVRVLDAARNIAGIQAVVVVTSDKVYQNNEWNWGYRETDTLGGNDPYSASKAAAEIATRSMAVSYFSGTGAARIATARAGNVIGGGDWAEFRLIPDAARSLSQGQPFVVRNPHSTRPWQHVLDPLAGYLMLAERIATDANSGFSSWNFGPAAEDALSVSDVADLFASCWGDGATWTTNGQLTTHKEAGSLAVDTTLARRQLGWAPRWCAEEAVGRSASWYRRHAEGANASTLVGQDIEDFISRKNWI